MKSEMKSLRSRQRRDIYLVPLQVKEYPQNIYTCPCPGSGAKDMPSKEKVIT